MTAKTIALSLPPLEELDDERKDKTLPGCAMFRGSRTSDTGEFIPPYFARVDQVERDVAHAASEGKSRPTMSRGISDVFDNVVIYSLNELQRRLIRTDAQLVFKEPSDGKTN